MWFLSLLGARGFALFCLALMLVGCSRESAEKRATGGATVERLRIAMIPKGTTHEFWKSVQAGGVKAARELDVDVIWKGPLREDDLKGQIDLVQTFTAQKVSALALAPLNDKALMAAVAGAQRAHIPVLVFDSALATDNIVSFVATDNFGAGGLAGKRMGEMLGGKGNVIVLRYQEGSDSTRQREEGFLKAVSEYPDIKVVSSNRYGGATTESAFSASESLLLSHEAAKGKVQGIFCPNESTTFGMLLALQKSGLASKVRFIGFDVSQKLEQGLGAGEIDALVVQDPFRMGYLAIKTTVENLRGQKVPARIDTGATLVEKSNLEDPKIKELLHPNLAVWLKGQ